MLKLRDIKKTYVVDEKRFPALKKINLAFPDKGFISILGPSGCGKTTLLNLIGGLDQYTSGDLIINNKSTKKFTDRDWDAYRNKRVGFVFQTYNLVPHLTVLGNVEISMTLTGMSKRERQKKAAIALKRVGLKDAMKKKPNQLSGGQMQRVAIARSLVNNPEIILADEPTGALDSVTSIQVMEILKEVSKDRLVLMVTHNDDLAKKYSTRIIRLKDGEVISDTNPQRGMMKKEKEELEKEKNKHTHMSFFTALGSSARSLLTKKGRTAMTAIAASFGIIGVSLVLAMSNGFSNYVHNVELSTASSVPITITPYVTTNVKDIVPDWEAWPSKEEIYPYDDDITSAVETHRNIITEPYAEYCRGLLSSDHHYAGSVLVNHEGLDFNVFTERPTETGGKEIIKIDQYSSAGTTGSILSSIGGLPSSIFHELYGGKDYITSLYDVVAGHYPESKEEVVLVCDRYNRIPLETLAKLGFIDSTADPDKHKKISFNDLLDGEGEYKYTAFMPDDVYKAVNENPIKKNTGPYYELEQVPSSPSSHYLAGLTDVKTEGKEIEQYLDVTDPKYHDELETLYNSGKGLKLRVVGIIRPSRSSQINLMPGSVCYTSELKDYYVNSIQAQGEDYRNLVKNNWAIVNSDYYAQAMEYLLVGLVERSLNVTTFMSYINKAVEYYDIVTSDETEGVKPDLASDSKPYTAFQENCYKFSTDFNPDPTHIIFEPLPVLVLIDNATLADALTAMNGYSTITSILIFPKDLSNKQQIFNYLDAWNKNIETEEDKILYSDIAGDITDAVGTLIDIISIVLIIFSSISLLVSCVMTGVITYTSVLERTKEIGILRAIGARKKDVGRLFEAESVIVGAIGGIIGILVTFIAEWPISLIIIKQFPSQNIGMICNLNPLHALLLVVVSILLTFVSGFIPARKAAKKDPVVALRTE